MKKNASILVADDDRDSREILSVWLKDWGYEAQLAHDGQEALVAPDPPPGPLGFVAWIDNQYAIATPRGDFGFGTLDAGPQWLELAHVRISSL